jgi:ABC-type nitrate/sulfonate/bicarbonate transport system substrate-binding protein
MRGMKMRAAAFLAVGLLTTAVAACGDDSSSEKDSAGTGSGEVKTLKVGVLPYLDYQAFYLAKEQGFDKELGYNLEFTKFPLEPNETKALARGDIQIGQGAIGSLIPQLPAQKDLKVFLSLSQYKGFAFVVRKKDGFKTFEDELAAHNGDADAARKAIVSQFKGKDVVTTASSYKATIAALLGENDSSLKDIKLTNFQEASQGAAAFIRGTGDIYLGAVAQTVRLLKMPEYQVFIKDAEMGPPGLWYSNAYVTDKYLQENRQQLLELTAIWYRTMRYMKEDTDKAYEQILKFLNPATASNMTVADLKEQIPAFTEFPTVDEAKKLTFATDSAANWKPMTEYLFEQNAKLGTKLDGITPEQFVVQEELFNEFLADKKLQEYVNKPF